MMVKKDKGSITVCDICGKKVSSSDKVGVVTTVNGAKCTMHLDFCADCLAKIEGGATLAYDPFTEKYSIIGAPEEPKKVIEAVVKETPQKESVGKGTSPEDALEGALKDFAAQMSKKLGVNIAVASLGTVEDSATAEDYSNASILDLLDAIAEEDFETQAGYLEAFIPWQVLYARLSTKQPEMDLPLGSVFTLGNKKVKVVSFDENQHQRCAGQRCPNCETMQHFKVMPWCQAARRKDAKEVMFVEVGE